LWPDGTDRKSRSRGWCGSACIAVARDHGHLTPYCEGQLECIDLDDLSRLPAPLRRLSNGDANRIRRRKTFCPLNGLSHHVHACLLVSGARFCRVIWRAYGDSIRWTTIIYRGCCTSPALATRPLADRLSAITGRGWLSVNNRAFPPLWSARHFLLFLNASSCGLVRAHIFHLCDD